MATANTALRVSELDYGSIRNNLKDFLRGQSAFDSYDFEGSGMAVLLDVLALNIHYMAMNLNLVGNEMFLDTAQLRDTVLSHAKKLNYVPTSRLGSTALINVQVTPGNSEDNSISTLTLTKNTRFLSDPIDGVSYNFLTVNSNTATKDANGTFLFSNVAIKQGELQTYRFLVDQNNPKRRFNIPSSNIDTTTLLVTVQESDVNSYSRIFTLAEDLTEVTANSNVYWVEETSNKQGSYTLYFGDGVLGTYLSNGNIVITSYLDTVGPVSNKAKTFNLAGTVSGYDANVIITTTSVATGGSEKEGIESIRFRSPLFYTTQNRAVTTQDYETLLLKDYPNIEAVSVWSGDDNVPPVYGKIFISLKPVENYEITTLEKDRIVNEIISNRSVLTVFPEIVDPDYTYILNNITVHYSPELTSYDEDQLKNLVKNTVLDYKDSELKSFTSIFRASRLQKYIDNCEPSINSNDISIYAQKRIVPTLGTSLNYTINFNISLKKGDFNDKLFSFPTFTVYDSLGVQRSVMLEETPDSFTGIDQIHLISGGSNYTEAPTVTISGDGTGATATASIINGAVKNITITNKGSNYTRATVLITGGNGSGASATAQLQFQNGTLRTFYFKSNGEKVIVNPSAGTIDYSEGIVVLTNFQPLTLATNELYDNTTLTINVPPADRTITTKRNQILDIDENDASSIQIVLVKD